MIAAVSILSALTVCMIGWCLQHAQRCADRDRQYEQRLTRLEDRVK